MAFQSCNLLASRSLIHLYYSILVSYCDLILFHFQSAKHNVIGVRSERVV